MDVVVVIIDSKLLLF